MSLELSTFLLILGLSSSVASPIYEKSCKNVCITVNSCATNGTICDDLTGPKYYKCQIKCNRVDMETIEKIELNNLFSYDEKPKLEQRNGVIDEEELREEVKEFLRAKLQNRKRDFDAERVGDENLHREKSCKKVCITVNTCATNGTLCDDLTGPKYSKCQIKCNRDDIMETIEKIELHNLYSYNEKPKLEQRNGVIDEEELREEFKMLLRAKLQNRKRDFDAVRVGDENLHRVKNLDILGVLDKSLVLLNSPWGISRRVKRTLPLLGAGIGGAAAGGAAGKIGGSIGAGIGLGPGGLTAGISGGASGEASGYAQGMAEAGAGTPGYGYPVAGYPAMIGK
ncbi:uncharacterized protein isoform X1 [Rhodnius prolixus]|uniref:uncharacterized protein isoform X1 n=1 Tax=Rhodnius prolixus TaxID=13249 RepID=UPI003D18B803